MADLLPFVGTRYAESIPRDRVVAPPYDVVSEKEQALLEARHAANAVRVELPKADPVRGLDAYGVAAELLESWQERGILAEDPAPALYPYRMTTIEGTSSTGVIGALGLEARPGAELLPHEETLPKPRSDRLELLRATRANLSPIWGLSPVAGLSAAIDTSGRPLAEATDDDGVLHELWRMEDPSAMDKVRELVGGAPVVIADGHHRLETARRYHEEQAQGPDDLGGADGSVMALVMELSPTQLHVGAIHRVVRGLPAGADLLDAFGRWFDMVRAGPSDGRTLRALADPETLALATTSSTYLLTPRPESAEAAGSELDSAIVALALGNLPPHEVLFANSRPEAIDLLTSGAAEAIVLLRPVGVREIAEWARLRRRMPPKTTYFAPKPRTGMVFRVFGD